MNQYGIRQDGKWLPRDANRRHWGERLDGPDLWQDRDKAAKYAEFFGAELVEFYVCEHVVKPVLLDLGEAVCGAV